MQKKPPQRSGCLDSTFTDTKQEIFLAPGCPNTIRGAYLLSWYVLPSRSVILNRLHFLQSHFFATHDLPWNKVCVLTLAKSTLILSKNEVTPAKPKRRREMENSKSREIQSAYALLMFCLCVFWQ